MLHNVVTSCSPWTKSAHSSPSPPSPTYLFLQIKYHGNTAICLHIVYGCFYITTTNSTNHERLYSLQSPISSFLALYRNRLETSDLDKRSKEHRLWKLITNREGEKGCTDAFLQKELTSLGNCFTNNKFRIHKKPQWHYVVF